MYDDFMRTTLTLDPDVAELVRQSCLSGKLSQKAVINDALRKGLGSGFGKAENPRFKVRPISSPFRSGLDTSRLNQLVDELEAEAFLAKQADQ